ncbi:MAG: VWA domain-containing protein [Alphaproteobacteria bacterium]|nr:VWA domain-containing protein [Alphaproteobacteria bacterium]
MFQFVWPLVFCLLPLPYLIRAILSPVQQGGYALSIPFYKDLINIKSTKHNVFKNNYALFKLLFSFIIWFLILSAAARPQWAGEAEKISSDARNVMLVLDLSGSMAEPDFVIGNQQVRRWDAVRYVVSDFIEKRQGDRIGIILFGERAYQYAPLTFDLNTLSTLISEAEVGMAGTQTAIGDALGLALKKSTDIPASSKVIILLSDGVSNAGTLTPEKATELCAKAGVKVYTIGIGSQSKDFIGFFGPRSEDIDEESLRKIATDTNALYFRAKTTNELKHVYDEINKIEAIKNDDVYIKPIKELFYYPLSIALLLSLFPILITILQNIKLQNGDANE